MFYLFIFLASTSVMLLISQVILNNRSSRSIKRWEKIANKWERVSRKWQVQALVTQRLLRKYNPEVFGSEEMSKTFAIVEGEMVLSDLEIDEIIKKEK